MINLITRISVIGISVITAALIILLSAFNGIEEMITRLYSEFDPDLSVRVNEGKSFDLSRIDTTAVSKIDGVVNYSFALEEEVILKHETKWTNATLIGVDDRFLSIVHMDSHLLEGVPELYIDNKPAALIGASLLDKLDGFIPANVGHESLIFYAPKKKIKLGLGKSPFYQGVFKLSGRYNFNREVNASTVLMPLSEVQEFIAQPKRASVLFVDVDSGSLDAAKDELKKLIGNAFTVKTNFEKNELIFKTSRSEKVIVILILVFIFILAAFNLIASLIMLFVEKKTDVATLHTIGADQRTIFKIFFYEGLLISGKGIIIGGVLGYAICMLQINFSLLTMPNTGGEVFPVALSLGDGLLIFSLVGVLSFLFSYFPVKYLVRNGSGNVRVNKE